MRGGLFDVVGNVAELSIDESIEPNNPVVGADDRWGAQTGFLVLLDSE